MNPEQSQPRQWPAVLQPIANLAERLEQNPPIDALRRSIAVLIAAGSLAVGVGHNIEQTLETSDEIVLACDVVDCGVGLPMPAPEEPPAIEAPIAVTAPVVVPETAPAARPQGEPLRHILEGRLQQVPTLQELGERFPGSYGDWQQQLEYINFLDQQSYVTPEDFHNFHYNDTFMGSFAGNGEYATRITPQLIIPHWTVHRYPAGLEGGQLFATGLLNHMRDGLPNPLSSNYFIDHEGSAVYRYYDEDTHKTAGALGMNDFGVNIELEAGLAHPTDAAPTVLYDVTPEALDEMVLTVVQLARRYNLAISQYTVVGHLAGDIIFVNSTFNIENGTVESLRKFDMPQELVAVIIRKAQILDSQLG